MTDRVPAPFQKPADSEEEFERKRAIMLQLTNISIVAAALESTATAIRQGGGPPAPVLANRLNGLALLLTENVALIEAETTGSRPIWH